MNYRWDILVHAFGVKDANEHRAAYDYDMLNRLVKITDPLGKTQQYGYDPEGNRVERSDGNGVHTTFTFDALNRLVSRNLPKGETEQFLFDAAGQMTSIKNAAVEIRYVYNSLGRVTEHSYP